jgi:hypothetical protein
MAMIRNDLQATRRVAMRKRMLAAADSEWLARRFRQHTRGYSDGNAGG